MNVKLFLRKIKHNVNKKFFSSKKSQCSSFDKTIFRNDDVSFDTNVDNFIKFCEVFHKYGYIQIHGIVLYGNTSCNYLVGDYPSSYENITDEEMHQRRVHISLNERYIGDNKRLIDYLNSIPDEIALHGYYHSDYSKMNFEEQEQDIREGLKLLKELFPKKEVKWFIAPFNSYNSDTEVLCQKYGLRLSAQEGEHFEDMMCLRPGSIVKNQLYRYHHHRFYAESTFTYYDLSIEKLDAFFEKYAYTHVVSQKKSKPSLEMLSNCVDMYNAQNWYKYAYEQFEARKHANLSYEWIKKHIDKDKKIVEVACGAGGMLYHLWANGFDKLYGYDYDEKSICVCKNIAQRMNLNIEFWVDNVRNQSKKNTYDVIVWVNGMYHLDNYSLDDFLYSSVPILAKNGYIVFDMIDKSFNKVPLNQYCTQDWNSDGKMRPSEYSIRMSSEEIKKVANKYNLSIIKKINATTDVIPRRIYILKKKEIKPRICLYCDRPNWAHDHSAQEIKKNLSDEFDIDIRYVISTKQVWEKYDILLVFFWGEESYKKFIVKPKKIIKQVSSHRWQFDKPYGPISVEDFKKKYLDDADNVICPSMILYNILNEKVDNIDLCGKGYSPEKFYYKKDRAEDISICMVGNIDDPVKGVKDLLIPACEGYKLDVVKNMKHEELVDFYNEHDIYVVSSIHEADPLPLIESMACGCFPISSKIGIAPELIRHKENGYLVEERTIEEFRKAIEWCNANVGYIRGQQKKISAEMYDTRRWDVMAENYREVFRKVMARK